MELNEITNILNKELQIENDVLMQNIEKKKETIKVLENEVEDLKHENNDWKKEYNRLQEEYNKIIYSRSYKLTQKIVKFIKK